MYSRVPILTNGSFIKKSKKSIHSEQLSIQNSRVSKYLHFDDKSSFQYVNSMMSDYRLLKVFSLAMRKLVFWQLLILWKRTLVLR